ncbi:carbamoyl phosphate synthase large subunit, partial [Alkalihalophilus lindianensis]|nr:carbamoyl phosphate synthase large subunit [Alkalihalophilus lindianensis]
KGLVASGLNIQKFGTVLFTVADKDKQEALKLAVRFAANGYRLMATKGTAAILESAGLKVMVVEKIGSEGKTLLDVI